MSTSTHTSNKQVSECLAYFDGCSDDFLREFVVGLSSLDHKRLLNTLTKSQPALPSHCLSYSLDGQICLSKHPERISGIKKVQIVIPSLSVDTDELQKVEGVSHYEERSLYSLLSLKDPSLYLIYVTSLPLLPSTVHHYLSLVGESASKRVAFFSTFDDSAKQTLTMKILQRPRLIAKIRQLMNCFGDVERDMMCFIPTHDEHELAKRLDATLAASPEDVQCWGTKSGSRKIFKESKVPHPRGVCESIWDENELAKQVSALWKDIPSMKRLVVKLNEGFSGKGNALLLMEPIASRIGDSDEQKTRISEIKAEFPNLKFESDSETWENFKQRIEEIGCIIEEFIEGEEKKSPSLQATVHEDGSTKILSTHEQVLGGDDGQVYLGCHFPCDTSYRLKLHQYGKNIAEALSKKGARGRFAVDFIIVPNGEDSDIFAIEINLRQGGTTHPYETLQLLTGGDYSEEQGSFVTEQGDEKYYVASDNLQKEFYRGVLPSDLISILEEHELLYNKESHTGCVLHLMGALSQFGKFGICCIGNSLKDSQAIYHKVQQVLDDELNESK